MNNYTIVEANDCCRIWTNKTLLRPVGAPRVDSRCYNTANNHLILRQQLPVETCGQFHWKHRRQWESRHRWEGTAAQNLHPCALLVSSNVLRTWLTICPMPPAHTHGLPSCSREGLVPQSRRRPRPDDIWAPAPPLWHTSRLCWSKRKKKNPPESFTHAQMNPQLG